jgi:hypothetical protein
MKLLSSDLSDLYSTLNDLIVALNEFADSQKYALIKKRTKINNKEVIRKTVFKCDRDENFKSQNFERRKTFTRSCECSFEVFVTLQKHD